MEITLKNKVYSFSLHAKERLVDRKISLGNIKRALKTKPYWNGQLWEHTLNNPRLKIQVDEIGLIVTLYIEDVERRERVAYSRGHVKQISKKQRYNK